MATLTTLNAASPLDADDGSRLSFTDDTDQTQSKDLDNVPANFGTMNSPLAYVVNARITGTPVVDEYSLWVRIMNGATVLAAGSAGGAFVLLTRESDALGGYFSHNNDTDFGNTFSYTNTSATKTQWDGASVELKQEWDIANGGDIAHWAVDIVSFDGGYTAAGTGGPKGPLDQPLSGALGGPM